MTKYTQDELVELSNKDENNTRSFHKQNNNSLNAFHLILKKKLALNE